MTPIMTSQPDRERKRERERERERDRQADRHRTLKCYVKLPHATIMLLI